jgi:hypothetical protein
VVDDADRLTVAPRPVSGLRVRDDVPQPTEDPLKAAANAARKAGYGLLARNAGDLDAIVAAALNATWTTGEVALTSEVRLKDGTRAITDEARVKAATEFTMKTLAAGYGLVTKPFLQLYRNRTTGKAKLVITAKGMLLRPAQQPQAGAA